MLSKELNGMSNVRPWTGTSSETLEMLGVQIAQSGKILDALLDGKVLALFYQKKKGLFRLVIQGRILPIEEDPDDSTDPQRVK